MTVNRDATKVGLSMGRRMQFGGEELTNLLVYEITKQRSMILKCQYFFTDPSAFPGARFTFDNHNPNYLIFFSKDRIFRVDYTKPILIERRNILH